MGQDNYKIYSFALAGSSALCEFFFHTHIIFLCLIKYFIRKKFFLPCICFILPTILKTIFSQIMYLFMYNIYTPTSDLSSRSWTSITHLRNEWDGHHWRNNKQRKLPNRDFPGKPMASHSSALAWKIPWTEEPGGLQPMGLLRVGHDWATSFSLSCLGQGNGNPLQCSCLENVRDGGAWWAAVYGVAQSWTRLKRLSCSRKSK